MDTKWKKSTAVVSFAVFFLGMTLLLQNFFSMLSLLSQTDFQAGNDYQKTEEFAGFISGRLEELLGAAVGGESWYDYSYGTAYENVYIYNGSDTYSSYTGDIVVEEAEEGFDFSEWWQRIFGGGTQTVEVIEDVAIDSGEANTVSSASAREASTEGSADTGQGNDAESGRDAYMKYLSEDKNILYAVVYQEKLLYTNIEGLDTETFSGAGTADFASLIPEEDYNFLLWFNQNGDGKVEITKDGQPVDVYGDGVYTPDSRWYVPGYTNFEAGDTEKEAVIFMAAAKEPKLYVTGNYSEGTAQRGERLYYMRLNLINQRNGLREDAVLIGAALLLLFVAFCMRKSLGEARAWLGRQFGKLLYEGKFLIFWILPLLILFLGILMGFVREMLASGNGVVICFWLFYFGFLDRRYNKGKQRSILRQVRKNLRTADLERPVQKRLVRRQWLIFAPGMALLLLLGYFFLILWDVMYWNAVIALFLILAFCVALFLGGSIIYLRKNRRLAEDIGALSDKIAAVRAGKLSEDLELPEDTDLREAAENLNEIRQGMETALEERTKSERMKVELVANVSHDLKTPLTSIVSYIELLKQEEDLPEHVKDYIRILGEKSERLGTMVQDVFEVSKAASGQLPVHMEELDFGKLLRQTLADMSSQIEKSGLSFRVRIPEQPVKIMADGQRMYRVFQNLLQNALAYSLTGSRVYLTLSEEDGKAQAVLKNTSAVELEKDVDFTERFVRGDKSRTDGGSGLGLSIARSFTEACEGQFEIETDADLFTATVTFPLDPA
ncbi:MAG TPA: HAMP domain-containing histidine kinase [Candidatus Merdisoma merdipullorum]|nr:HAMP domain-containing histidine kinase [Candidatus Merdisoma merdipullorum]